jgi:hypothetical protein
MALPAPNLSAQIASVQREIKLRRRLYPGRVSRGRMSPRQALYEVACMEAVLTELMALHEAQQARELLL